MMSRMSTARRIVAVNAAGEVSGAEVVLLGLLAHAAEQGAELVVASPAGPLVERLPAGTRHVELPPAGRGWAAGRMGKMVATGRWLGSWPAAARRLAADVDRPDTHTVVNSLLALPLVRMARPWSPPVWFVHDVLATRQQRAFARAGAGACGRIVAVSAAAAAPLRALGLDVAVRRNGVEWPVEPIPGELHDPPVVGSLGLLAPWKGQDDLLEAVARLPDVRLELAGGHFGHDAGFAAELRRRAAAADLRGRVTFHGHVDDPLAALRGWDVMVSASTSPEAGPMTVIEAMSVGLPVVATNHGGPREYLAGDRGELVTPGAPAELAAAIARLLADARYRHAVADRGRRYVAEHCDRRVTFPAQYTAVMEP